MKIGCASCVAMISSFLLTSSRVNAFTLQGRSSFAWKNEITTSATAAQRVVPPLQAHRDGTSNTNMERRQFIGSLSAIIGTATTATSLFGTVLPANAAAAATVATNQTDTVKSASSSSSSSPATTKASPVATPVTKTTVSSSTSPPSTTTSASTTKSTTTTPPPPKSPATTNTPNPKLANPGDVKNCPDFKDYNEAKTWYDTYFPLYGDVARLDGNNDGIPCESLKGAPPKKK